jgi:hypothetical protein
MVSLVLVLLTTILARLSDFNLFADFPWFGGLHPRAGRAAEVLVSRDSEATALHPGMNARAK